MGRILCKPTVVKDFGESYEYVGVPNLLRMDLNMGKFVTGINS